MQYNTAQANKAPRADMQPVAMPEIPAELNSLALSVEVLDNVLKNLFDRLYSAGVVDTDRLTKGEEPTQGPVLTPMGNRLRSINNQVASIHSVIIQVTERLAILGNLS